MAIPVECKVCGSNFTLKDDFAGRRVRCSNCQEIINVPTEEELADFERASRKQQRDEEDEDNHPRRDDEDNRERKRRDDDTYEDDDRSQRERRLWDADEHEEDWGDLDPAFRYDKFLMRQKLFTLVTEKYNVTNEYGDKILFIQRPAHFMQSCLAVGVFFLMLSLAIGGAVALSTQLQGGVAVGAGVAIGLVGLALAFYVFWRLIPRRHITFYTDESMTEPILRVLQDQKIFLINAWYTLIDDQGRVLCRFRKNYLYNIFRKRWYIYSPEGELLYLVKEDSLIMSLLRRTFGFLEDYLSWILQGIFRTNFIFLTPDESKILGEFNRKFTIVDRYVLDMTRDRKREMDRRIAVAMGVMLDTGEAR